MAPAQRRWKLHLLAATLIVVGIIDTMALVKVPLVRRLVVDLSLLSHQGIVEWILQVIGTIRLGLAHRDLFAGGLAGSTVIIAHHVLLHGDVWDLRHVYNHAVFDWL